MKLPKRLSIKIFASNPEVVDTAEFVPVLQRWIQRNAIQGELLIDVVDYKHVYQGPGVMLIGHESDYGYDLAEGRHGLLYTIKNYDVRTLSELVNLSLARAIHAAKLLQGENSLNGLSFSTSELQIKFLDRLAYPHNEQTITTAQKATHEVLSSILGEVTTEAITNDSREPIGFTVKFANSDDLDTWASQVKQTTAV